MADQPYQSLYRRFRPQRFDEVRGQEHITRALRNAVRENRVAHAYLFSGPRGTGKTSTARILAKALNCANVVDGEPCGVCDSCVQVQQGNSLDVYELDAASNNGVDAMRDLVSRAALGTPGRWKVYIVDEVHMLSTAAANALLKTLEEPPSHVIFVLATTDPQKVLPTIKSRTQHYEFHLMSADVLGALLKDINDAAGLGVQPEAIDLVVRRGHGSARDALSVLDQVAALAGEVEDASTVVDDLVDALCDRDAGRALVAIAEGAAAGRDPRQLAVDILEHLRNGFLATMAKGLVLLPDDAAVRVEEQARQMGPAALVRAMEVIGEALADMRESLDPRVTLEVAIVRVAKPEADTTPAALLERIERLERREPAQKSNPPSPPPPDVAKQDAPPQPSGSRPTIGAIRGKKSAPPPQPKAEAPKEVTPSATHEAGNASMEPPTRDALTQAWGDKVKDKVSRKALVRFAGGRFLSADGGAAVYALPNQPHLSRCEEVRGEVEAALSDHFGQPVRLQLVVDNGPTLAEPEPDEQEEHIDLEALEDAGAPVASPEERLKQAFPGAEEVTP
jgi:DNA polymerase III subunit gamma/tau